MDNVLFSGNGKHCLINDYLDVVKYPVMPDMWRKDPKTLLEEAQNALGAELRGFDIVPKEQ